MILRDILASITVDLFRIGTFQHSSTNRSDQSTLSSLVNAHSATMPGHKQIRALQLAKKFGVNLDHIQKHLGKHLQKAALFSLPRLLIQSLDQSLDLHDDGGVSDQDAMSEGHRWIRDDGGRGWSIVLRRRGTFIALASFLNSF